jgi:hypothetical protein
MKGFTISIPKEKLRKIDKAAARIAEIEGGLRRPVSKVHKSAKSYTRKPKYKVAYI